MLPIKLIGKEPAAEGTMTFIFEKPAGYSFAAGQHMDMRLTSVTETDIDRHFTLACSPADNDLRITTRMRDSGFKRLLGAMEIGTLVNIGPAHGSFTLHDDGAKTAVFLAGGIGITAAYAMIKDATERQLSHEIVLIYSNRRPEDAPFLAALQQFAAQNQNLALVLTMTEVEKSTVTWTGQTGMIDESMLEQYVPAPQKQAIYYASGPPAMVTAMHTLLTNWGVPDANIKTEEFIGYDIDRRVL
jgi:ferredoxin-NADP reductase